MDCKDGHPNFSARKSLEFVCEQLKKQVGVRVWDVAAFARARWLNFCASSWLVIRVRVCTSELVSVHLLALMSVRRVWCGVHGPYHG